MAEKTHRDNTTTGDYFQGCCRDSLSCPVLKIKTAKAGIRGASVSADTPRPRPMHAHTHCPSAHTGREGCSRTPCRALSIVSPATSAERSHSVCHIPTQVRYVHTQTNKQTNLHKLWYTYTNTLMQTVRQHMPAWGGAPVSDIDSPQCSIIV